MQVRIAVVGDVHGRFDARDVEELSGRGYDLVLFAGDLAGYLSHEAIAVARLVARLRVPALVVPGNHDGTHLLHLGAEMFQVHALRNALGGLQHRRVRRLERALAPARLAGYSLHPFDALGLTVIAGRPHSMGPSLAFRRHLARAHGVHTVEESAARLCALVDRAPHDRLLLLAHNGPAGLGPRRDDPFGCDFRPEEGDFGDPDLRAAVDHALARGRRVLAVVAGHMHHALRGGGTRRWQLERDGVLYVNAARVPRIFRHGGRLVRHHVCLTLDEDGARADEVLA